jgi:hypothetical protein
MTTSVHVVQAVTFVGDRMIVEVDGKTFEVDLRKHSARLLRASDEDRRNYAVSPSGYGIHWPMIDEDLSVDRLIGATHEVPAFRRTASPARDTDRKPPARHPA